MVHLINTLFGNIVGIDRQVEAWFYAIRDATAVKVFLLITWLGKSWVVIILALAVSVILWLTRKRWQIFVLWLTTVGTGIFVYLAKIALDRIRPIHAVYLEHSASFPSGHAAIAIAFYGFLTYLLLREIKKYRALTLFLGAIIILAIGFSRLYLGVHYLSDVLVGYLIGAVWLVIGIKINKLKSNPKIKP